jgi:ABC-type Mn2+/Zn2+ transport system permease subunit
MFHNGNFNLPVVVVLFTLLFGNAYHLLTNSCESKGSIIWGVVFGFVLGSAVFLSILQSGNGELLYFGEVMSNNAVCKVDRKKYICFKDGKQLKFE